MGILNTYPQIAGLHAPTHQPGGEDPVVGIPPAAHAVTHILAGTDPIIGGLDARALNLANQGEIVFRAAAANTLVALAVGGVGQALLSGGAAADVLWGAPAPAAHVLDTTGPHTGTLPLTDLVVGVQGEVIIRGAADWEALGVGTALQALLSGGAGVDPYWGAPTPAAHILATTGPHSAPLPLIDLEVAAQGEIITRTGADWVAFAVGGVGDALLSGGGGADVSWGAPAPAAHVLATTGPHTDTLPLTDLAVGARGSVIRRGAADWEELALGTNTYVLKSGATDVAWGQVGYGELSGVPATFAPSSHTLQSHTGDLIYTQLDSIVDTAGAGANNLLSRADHVHTAGDGSSKITYSNLLDAPGGFTLEAIEVVDKSTTTTGSWRDVTCSAIIPEGATYAIGFLRNIDSNATYYGGVRPNGGGNEGSYTYLQKTVERYFIVALDANRIFEQKIDNADIDCWITGYII